MTDGIDGTDGTDSAETGRVDLPADLTERLEDRVAATEFDSVDAYVAFALDRLLAEVEAMAEEGTTAVGEEAAAGADATDSLDTEQSEAVADRLDSLGYL